MLDQAVRKIDAPETKRTDDTTLRTEEREELYLMMMEFDSGRSDVNGR